MQLLKHLLLVTVIDAQIVHYKIGDIARVAADDDAQQHLGRHVACQLHILIEHSYAGAHERVTLCAVAVVALIRQQLDLADKMRI